MWVYFISIQSLSLIGALVFEIWYWTDQRQTIACRRKKVKIVMYAGSRSEYLRIIYLLDVSRFQTRLRQGC